MTKEQFVKRLKSLAWRGGAVALVALINFIIENLGSTGLSASLVTIIGLVLGEVTKAINNYMTGK